MRRTAFIALFLGAWTVLVFGLAHAGDLRPVKCEHNAPVSENLEGRFLFAAVSHDDTASDWYVTQSGYVAAVQEELLDRAIFWAGFGDGDDFESFISSSPLVFPLKGGLRVHLEKFSWCGKVRIRPEGSNISVWTVREAIRSAYPRNIF